MSGISKKELKRIFSEYGRIESWKGRVKKFNESVKVEFT